MQVKWQQLLSRELFQEDESDVGSQLSIEEWGQGHCWRVKVM